MALRYEPHFVINGTLHKTYSSLKAKEVLSSFHDITITQNIVEIPIPTEHVSDSSVVSLSG